MNKNKLKIIENKVIYVINRRNTCQRKKIIEYLRSVNTHPNAEMVYEGIKNDMPNIGIATIYRNLNLLAKQGQILKIEVNNEARFDGDISNHQHCVCDRCGCVQDFFDKEISDYAMMRITSDDFIPTSVMVLFHGICKKCSRGDGNRK